MATSGIVIRVAANLEELRKNLAAGGDMIHTTTAAMGKLASSLDGNKLFQNANNIVAAVDKIGGASKLTEAEQARLNTTLAKAIEKYEVMGKTAPNAMVDLEAATRKATEPTVALSVAMGTLAAQLVTRAAAGLVEFGKEALMTSARVETLGGVAKFMGAQAGFTATEIDALVSALRRQGITSQQANDTVIQMVRANLSLADATKLATVAQSLARATGENSSVTLGKLIQGTQTLQVEVLRNAGVVIQLDQEYKKFAKTNDRTVESLGAQEKQQIALAAVLREGEKVAGVYGVTNEFVGGKIQSLTRHQEEAAKSIGDVFKPALKVGVDVLTEFLKIVQAAPELFAGLGVAVIGLSTAFITLKSAATLGLISTSALSTGLSVLWPIVAVGATAFASWKLGTLIGEVSGLTDGVERLSGRMMGLSKTDIDAGMAARKFAESAGAKTAALDAQAKSLADLETKARATADAAMAHAAAEQSSAAAVKAKAEAAEKAKAAFEKWNTSIAEASFGVRRLVVDVGAVPPAIASMNASMGAYDLIVEHGTDALLRHGEAAKKAEAELQRLGMSMPNLAIQSQNVSAEIGERLPNAFDKLKGVAKSALGGLNDIFQRAFEGGGGIGGAIKSMATNMASGLLSMIPMVGPFISQFSGAIIAGLSKLGGLFGIGPSQGRKDLLAANEDIKKLQDELLKTYGSLDKIREMGGATGQALADAWGSQGAAGLEHLKGLAHEFAAKLKQDTADQAAADKAAADAKVQYAKDQQDLADAIKTKQDMLTAAVERYKFTLEELGPAMKNQKLSEQAEQLLNDFSMLVGSGINVDTVIKRMGGSINDFVKNALKTGTEVPEAMRPMLEAMIKQGTLTDANGKKITDLKTSGISFGETLTKGFSRVVEKLDELIQRLTGKLAPAMDTEVPDAAAEMALALKRQAEVAEKAFQTSLIDLLIGADGVTDAMDEVSSKMGNITKSAAVLDKVLARPVTKVVTVQWDVPPTPTSSNWQNFPTNSGGSGPQDVIPFDTWIEDFVRRNGEEDRNRGREAYGNVPGVGGHAMGTQGRYIDFGAGTPTTLHGRERIMTEAEGRTEATRASALGEELRGLRADLARSQRDLPRAMAMAMQGAMVLAR